MNFYSTMTVANGSSVDDNTAGVVSSPAFALVLWARGWLAK